MWSTCFSSWNMCWKHRPVECKFWEKIAFNKFSGLGYWCVLNNIQGISFPDYDIVIVNCYHVLKSELMSTIFRKLYWKIHSFLSIVSCGVLRVCSLVSAWMLECSSSTDSH